MVEPLRHRQTKGAATDMPGLPPPRHIPTLPTTDDPSAHGDDRVGSESDLGTVCCPAGPYPKVWTGCPSQVRSVLSEVADMYPAC